MQCSPFINSSLEITLNILYIKNLETTLNIILKFKNYIEQIKNSWIDKIYGPFVSLSLYLLTIVVCVYEKFAITNI